jgi:hypothetical protein
MTKLPNPAAEKLTDAEKEMLRAIHAKYSVVGKSPLQYVVHDGEQTFNIKLD